MFSWLEKNPFFFAVVFLLVFSVAGLVEILPQFAKAAKPIEGLRPYTVLELAGKKVYEQEGCYTCHSQLIRPFKSETDRYGAYSLSGEYAYDRPHLWGSKRTGPDLHRVGDYRTTDWHENHMMNPNSVVPDSIMPAYKSTFKNSANFENAFADAYTSKVVFGVPYDVAGGVRLGSIGDAKEEFMREAKLIIDDMKNQSVKDAFERGEVKEIVALIAYMNSLGQSRRANSNNK